ncbi:MAG TPA: hypothetical protein VF734_04585 [Pseudonocardiaceae bacterium]
MEIGDADGNTIVVSIAWVRMHNASRAIRLQQLVGTDGTGNVSPIAGQLLELRGIPFTDKHYASRRTGSLVVMPRRRQEVASQTPRYWTVRPGRHGVSVAVR